MVMDFAMKFEETKYLEKQDEFYAKRGMTWHIKVLAFNENKRLKTVTLVHLMEEKQQDSFVRSSRQSPCSIERQ